MPHATFEVMEGKRRNARFVESSRVAHNVELVEITQQCEADLGVFVDAFSEQDVALGSPACV